MEQVEKGGESQQQGDNRSGSAPAEPEKEPFSLSKGFGSKDEKLKDGDKDLDPLTVIYHQFENRLAPDLGGQQGTDLMGFESVTLDQATNTLFVEVPESRSAQASIILSAMDQAQDRFTVRCVMVIAELTTEETFSLDWLVSVTEGKDVFKLWSGSVGSSSATIEASNFEATLQRAGETGYLEVISRPSISVSSGERGRISSGREIPIPSRDFQQGNVAQSIEFREVDLSLEVTVQKFGDQVSVQLEQVNDSLGPVADVSGIEVPSVISQKWTSGIVVTPGSWYAVGGVASSSASVTESRGLLGRLIPTGRTRETRRAEIGLFFRVDQVGPLRSEPDRADLGKELAPAIPYVRCKPVKKKRNAFRLFSRNKR